MYYERLMEVTGLTKQAGMEKAALSPQFLARTLTSALKTKRLDRAAHFYGLLKGRASNPAYLENWMENGQNMNFMQKAFMRGKLHNAYTNAVPAEGALRIVNNSNAPGMKAVQQQLDLLDNGGYNSLDAARGFDRATREYRPNEYHRFMDNPNIDFHDYKPMQSALQRANAELSDAAMTNPALWN